ncbi:hypothetical protein PIB30_030917 [Stylosanthes scabra]|uniref:Uncharacterized protein n=1 Tax=Stylosanthes scabra TaxID=79078 RepID=A0ABU6ZAU5_9FABA|nr:hypothetical protein [Stylosanthes scabra]
MDRYSTKNRATELPFEIILKIIVSSDTPTFVRCWMLSHQWKDILQVRSNIATHFKHVFGESVVLQIENLLDRYEVGSLALYDLTHGRQLIFYYPVQLEWFHLIGSSNGVLAARFSMDRRDSEIILWNPVTSKRITISDPRNPCFSRHVYVRDMLSYSLVVDATSNQFQLIVFRKKIEMASGYTLYTYNSIASSWSDPFDAPDWFWTMSEHPVVVGRRIFWLNLTGFQRVPYSIIGYCIDTDSWVETIIPPHAVRGSSCRLAVEDDKLLYIVFERTSRKIGVHLYRINILDPFEMAWSFSSFCGDNYLTQTPFLIKENSMVGIIHSVVDSELFYPNVTGWLSEIHFIKLNTNGCSSTTAGSLRWNHVIEIGPLISYSPSLIHLVGFH